MPERARPAEPGGALVGLYGAGAFGREVHPMLLDELNQQQDVVFVEEAPSSGELHGVPIMTHTDFVQLKRRDRLFALAIADGEARRRLAKECLQSGAKPIPVLSPRSTVYAD